jgi:hypothetical protein
MTWLEIQQLSYKTVISGASLVLRCSGSLEGNPDPVLRASEDSGTSSRLAQSPALAGKTLDLFVPVSDSLTH